MNRYLLAAVLAAVFFTGCARSINTVENTDKTMQRSFVRNKRVVSDDVLERKMEVLRIDKAELPTGLLQVQLTVRNKKRDGYRYAYQFQWFDVNGINVQTSAQTWVEKSMGNAETQYISAVAPSPRCRDFVVKFKLLE